MRFFVDDYNSARYAQPTTGMKIFKYNDMKNLLLLFIAAALFIGTAEAKIPVKYMGEVDAVLSVGVGNFATPRVGVHTIHGVRLGQYFSTGIGIGADFYTMDSEVVMPLYLNLKGHLPTKRKATPFMSLDLGTGLGVSSSVAGFSGLYCTPAVGVKVRKFKVQLGYNIQQITDSGFGFSMGAVQLKLGCIF